MNRLLFGNERQELFYKNSAQILKHSKVFHSLSDIKHFHKKQKYDTTIFTVVLLL